jgi:hypothetical protein
MMAAAWSNRFEDARVAAAYEVDDGLRYPTNRCKVGKVPAL